MEISSIERVEQTSSQPGSLRPAGCPERERTRRKKYRAGYDDEGTSAHTARLRNARLTPLSKIGRTTCMTPMSSVWSTRTRVGRICRRFQARPVGTVPRHRRGRDRPGLSAHSHPAETLWPLPGSGRGRAAGTTVYHLPSAPRLTEDVTPTESERAGIRRHYHGMRLLEERLGQGNGGAHHAPLPGSG